MFWVVLVVTSAAQAGERGAVGDLYVCNVNKHNILQFDGITGDFVCIFAVVPPGVEPVQFRPFDLAWAPNGHLWVSSVSTSSENIRLVAEYDGESGAFIQYVVPPEVPSPPSPNISFGGPDAHLAMTIQDSVCLDSCTQAYDRVTFAYLGIMATPAPPMDGPQKARFTSFGTYWILGNAGSSPIPTIREYDPSTAPYTFVRNVLVESGVRRNGVIETPDGCCFLVSEITGTRNNIEKFEIATGAFLGELVPSQNTCLAQGPETGPDCTPICPDYWDALDGPIDLAYGPNGNLYVSAERTHVPTDQGWQDFGICQVAMGAMHEFDPETGEQIGVIGKADMQEFALGIGNDPERIYKPGGIEFKPMPGDYGGSGAAFQGDWVVDENDLQHFVEALVGTGPPNMLAANLLSFDFDRSGAVDGQDISSFVQAILP